MIVLAIWSESWASGAVVTASEQQNNNNRAAEMFLNGKITPLVFQNADNLLASKYAESFGTKLFWTAAWDGFEKRQIGKCIIDTYIMVLRWDGSFVVRHDGFFSSKVLEKGDWTKWLK